jgi:hypothetical protein
MLVCTLGFTLISRARLNNMLTSSNSFSMTAISALQAVARLASKEVQALPQISEAAAGASSKLASEAYTSFATPAVLRAKQFVDATFNTGAVKQIDDVGLRNAADFFTRGNSLNEQLAATPLRVSKSQVFANIQTPEAMPHYARAMPKDLSPHAGDIVASSNSTVGTLQKFVRDPDGKKVGILELQAARAVRPLDSFDDLHPITPRLWKTQSGMIYTARHGVSEPHSLQHMVPQPAMRAAEADTLKVLQMQRPLSPEAQKEIADNGFIIDLVAKSYENGFSLKSTEEVRRLILGKLSNAPEHHFTDTPFLSWRAPSTFNPSAGAHNCMGCTAAVFRTLGRIGLTTADDVAKLSNKQKLVIGDPAPGRFRNEVDAMDWFSKAAGVKFTGVAENINNAAPGNYAAIMRIDNSVSHMVFAHKPSSGAGFFYDAQSGVRLNNKSVTDWKRGVVFNRMDIVKNPEYF